MAGNPDAIGYVSMGSAGYAATHGVPSVIQDISAEGVDTMTP